MSYTTQQIEQQNAQFKQALLEKRISQTEYNDAMAKQRLNMMDAQKREQVYKVSETQVYQRTQQGPQTQSVQGYVLEPKQQPQQTQQQQQAAQSHVLGSNIQRGFIPPAKVLGQETLLNTPEKRTTALEAMVAVAAPVVAPAVGVSATSVLLGEGLSTGINQGFKAVQGGGLLTPQEAIESAAIGGSFSLIGGGANKALRLTGSGIKAATGRILVGTGLGATGGPILEFAKTGKATKESVYYGAAFGFAFSGVSEVARVSYGKISNKMIGKLDKSYTEAGIEGEIWKPSFVEKIYMKTTGYRPTVAQEIFTSKSTPQQRLSFKDLVKGTPEEDYFWSKPTPKTTELWMLEPETSSAKVSSWANEHLFIKGPMGGGLSYSQTLQRAPLEFLEFNYEQPYNPQLSIPFIPNLPTIATIKAPTFNLMAYPTIIKAKATSNMATPFQGVKTIQKQQQQLRQSTKQSQLQHQVIIQGQTQTQSQRQMLKATQALIGAQTTNQTLSLPKISQTKNVMRFPNFNRAGDFSNRGAGRGLYGKWYLKHHKIKTYSQMLTTFGIGQAGKPLRNIENATNRLFKVPKPKRRKIR